MNENNEVIEFDIPGTLPTMNEMINLSKTHWAEYREMKAIATNKVVTSILSQNIPKINNKIDIRIKWVCPNKRHDKDNIASGAKFIWDGLVKAGIIPNDTWKYQRSTTHLYDIDKVNPYIHVTIFR